jgi:branched-chain amino acid transport system ATP-binding protein
VIAIKTEGIQKRFGGFYALNGVSMEVPNGQIALVIGPNGSGKTTLINCISGIYKPEVGRILHHSTDITGKPPNEVVKTGLVRTFQIPEPFYTLTVLENLLVGYQNNPGENPFWSLFNGKWLGKENRAVEKALKILELVNLDSKSDALASELSGGQLKLLEMGRALMVDAKTILLDEPIGSINPVLAHEILSQIQRLKDNLGLTFLIVEHRIEITVQYVDYIYAMARGQILSEGLPEKVMNDPKVIESYLCAP